MVRPFFLHLRHTSERHSTKRSKNVSGTGENHVRPQISTISVRCSGILPKQFGPSRSILMAPISETEGETRQTPSWLGGSMPVRIHQQALIRQPSADASLFCVRNRRVLL